jgi:hypothetical protein
LLFQFGNLDNEPVGKIKASVGDDVALLGKFITT